MGAGLHTTRSGLGPSWMPAPYSGRASGKRSPGAVWGSPELWYLSIFSKEGPVIPLPMSRVLALLRPMTRHPQSEKPPGSPRACPPPPPLGWRPAGDPGSSLLTQGSNASPVGALT